MEETTGISKTLYSAEPLGLDVSLLEVEVHATSGLPRVDIVGLAEACVRESKQRVRAAVTASGWRFPEDKITINLAPPSVKKTGTGLDLAMALGILIACKKIHINQKEILNTYLFLGELSLSGKLKPVQGTLNVAMTAKRKGIKNIILPLENVREVQLISGLSIYPARSLREVCKHIEGKEPLSKMISCEPNSRKKVIESERFVDLADIKGQSLAKRALIIAASGGHNLLFVGPPGSGKTLLMNVFPSLLPDLSLEEAMESMQVHSCAGLLKDCDQLMRRPPYRTPHHSITDAGFIGGGKNIHPGELSLAHNGVLFLDELPEFKRHVLEMLREPLESGWVLLSRANGFLKYPARFQLLAAMNPCPCGYSGVGDVICKCSSAHLRNYTRRISGPLLDRLDLRLHLNPVPYAEFFKKNTRKKKMVHGVVKRPKKRLKWFFKNKKIVLWKQKFQKMPISPFLI